MWRLKALLGRVLHRWPIAGPSSSLRLPPTYCAEDDRLNPPALVGTDPPSNSRSTDAQNGGAGRKRREEEEQRARFYSKQLPRFSGLDAVGWGAAAVVLLQFVRHLHRQLRHRHEPQESDTDLRLCAPGFILSTLTQDRIKLSRCILPRCVDSDSISRPVVHSTLSTDSSPPADGATVHFKTGQEHFENVEQDEPLFMKNAQRSECNATDGTSLQPQLQTEEPNSEEALKQATSDLQGAAESSISSILNIIGIGNVKAKDDDMAFSCFLMGARQGYSKAQYNVGVCYELGRGTAKDIEKAALYYSRAAAQGHAIAQYRWARYLLEIKPGRDVRDAQTAIEQFKKAAESGLREAQAYLGVFYTNKPHQDLRQAVRYFTMASRSGDPTSQYHLGICYQEGWGVLKDDRRAVDLYKQAAALGQPDAQCALGIFHQKGLGGLPVNLWKAMELYQKAVHTGSEEAGHNLRILTKQLHVKGGFGLSHGCSPLRCVMSSPCLCAPGTLIAPLPHREADTSSLPPDAPLLPHSWSTGSLHTSPLGTRVPDHLLQADRRLRFPAGPRTFLGAVPGVG